MILRMAGVYDGDVRGQVKSIQTLLT